MLQKVSDIRRNGYPIRYYFHVRDSQGFVPDEEGSELPDLAAARQEARLSAGDFAIEALRSGDALADRAIEIADDSGAVLEILRVRELLC